MTFISELETKLKRSGFFRGKKDDLVELFTSKKVYINGKKYVSVTRDPKDQNYYVDYWDSTESILYDVSKCRAEHYALSRLMCVYKDDKAKSLLESRAFGN